MTIAAAHLQALAAFGYTEDEARFLYLVATHSGYFVARQFLAFTGAHWGKRTTLFWMKLHTNEHARTERFPKSGVVYHLFARRLYRQIGRENLRNRREHETQFIQRRIAILDYVLANDQRNYLETEPEKLSYFCGQRKIASHLLPSKTYHGQRTSQPTVRCFVDKFPMFLDGPDSCSPVVTFSYVQGAEANLTEFVRHVEAYLPLFRELPEFGFLYLARTDSLISKARELFDSLVTVPLESNPAADLLRYFQIRKAWDLRQYAAVTEADLIFRNQAKARFTAEVFEHLYRGWKVGRVTEAEIQNDFGSGAMRHAVHFRAEVLRPYTGDRNESHEER
jgi:hypothetical protein